MMTREDYYAQIKDMYAQMYESTEPTVTRDSGFVISEEVRQELIARFQELRDTFNRLSISRPEMTPDHQPLARTISKETDVIETEIERTVETAKNSDSFIEPLEHELVSQVVGSVSDVLLVHKVDSHVMEVEKLSQKSTSGNGENVAHQLFDQMPLRIASKEKRRKSLKAWKFKFKPTSKRSKSMDVKFFSVEEIAWFTKDSKEINWGCVNKEFKEAVAGCGKTRVDQLKLVHATPRPGVYDRPLQTRVWDSGGSLLECVDEKSFGYLMETLGSQYKGLGCVVVKKKLRNVEDGVKQDKNRFSGDVEAKVFMAVEELHLLQDVFELVKELPLKTSLVSPQVMRNTKRKFTKQWMFKYKSEFPRHHGVDIEAFFGVEFYELKYRKLHISHCFAVQEFYGIHGSISGPWHLAFDPGGIISCTACEDFVVTHTQWVGHDKLEGCNNVQTLATYVDVEEKQAYVSVLQAVIEIHQDSHFVFLAGYDVRALEILQVGDNGAETVGAEQFQHNEVEEVSLSKRKNDRADVILSHQGKQTLTRQKKKNWRTTWRFKFGESQFVLLLGDESFQIKHKWRFKLLPLILECELYSDRLVLVTNYAQQFDISVFFSTNIEVKVSSKEGDLIQENERTRGGWRLEEEATAEIVSYSRLKKSFKGKKNRSRNNRNHL